MDFFGIGSGEILLVLIVALIIFGPGRIVEISQRLGKMMHTLRKASFDLTSQVSRELDIEEKNHSSASDGKKPEKPRP